MVTLHFFQTTLFLRQTLSRQKFLEVLATRPAAVRQLTSYLTTRAEIPDLVDILSGLGRYHESGLIFYQQALSVTKGGNIDARTQRLRGVLSSPQFQSHADWQHVTGKKHFR